MQKRVLMLNFAFVIILSLAVNTASAAQPTRGTWNGYQCQVPAGTPVLKENYVIILDAKMICCNEYGQSAPYVFGDIHVLYETIEWMAILMDPDEFLLYPEDAVFAKRFGRFTWYGPSGPVAKGRFVFNGNKQIGYLWAKGLGPYSGLFVKGTFWMTETGLMWHQGWYIISE